MEQPFHDSVANWIIISIMTFNTTSGFLTYSSSTRKTPASIYTFVLAILWAFYTMIIGSIPLGLYRLNIHLFMFCFAPLTFIGPVIFLMSDSYIRKSKKIRLQSLWLLAPGVTGLLFSLATTSHSDQELVALVESYEKHRFLEGLNPSMMLWATSILALLQQIIFYWLSFFRVLYAHIKRMPIDGSHILLLLAIVSGPLLVGAYDVLVMIFNLSVNSILVIAASSVAYAMLLFKNSQMERSHQRQTERRQEEKIRNLEIHRHKAEIDLQRMRQDASRNEAVARMTQMLAHDVRKPFSILRMGIGMLGQAKDPAGVKAILGRVVPEIDKAVKSVDSLIADVMEVGSSSTQLIQEPASPESLIESTIGEAFRIYPKADIGITYDLQHTHMVSVHVQKVARVFSNIIETPCRR